MTIGRAGAEAHDLVGGQKRPAGQVFAAAGSRGSGLERPAGVARAVGGLERDRVVAKRIADVVRGVVIGDPEILLRGVSEKTLPSRIGGLELRQVLDEKPELGAVAA
jgi:hypothetical protein